MGWLAGEWILEVPSRAYPSTRIIDGEVDGYIDGM